MGAPAPSLLLLLLQLLPVHRTRGQLPAAGLPLRIAAASFPEPGPGQPSFIPGLARFPRPAAPAAFHGGGGGGNGERRTRFDVSGLSRGPELHDLLKAEVMLRRLKRDVLSQVGRDKKGRGSRVDTGGRGRHAGRGVVLHCILAVLLAGGGADSSIERQMLWLHQQSMRRSLAVSICCCSCPPSAAR